MGYMERASRGNPCIFCGDVGYDMRIHYPETEDVVHWCHKTDASKGDIVTVDGKDYICIGTDRRTKESTMGKFCLWKEYLSKEEWMEKQSRINPDWNTKSFSGSSYKPTGKPAASAVSLKTPKEGELLEGEEKPLPNRELDKIYRAFLSMLVLEDKHKAALLEEWKSPLHDISYLVDDFLIRSLPPADKPRFKSDYRYKNPTRKSIFRKLVSMFGSLRGVPGFYLRTGDYYDGQPESERWTVAAGEGVLFPCYDKDGYIYRLRLKEERPDLELKPGKSTPYKGMYGYFNWFYDDEGYLKCHFVPRKEEGREAFEVDSQEAYGKPRGKYKTLSSAKGKRKGDKVVNQFFGGAGSGSPYSLYTHPEDDFTVVYGPEGEKKGMVANAIKHAPSVSIPGVSCYSVLFVPDGNGVSLIDYLVSRGMKYFIICYDADKDENESVAEAEKELAGALKAHNVIPLIASWEHGFEKGIDDILLMGLDVTVSPA